MNVIDEKQPEKIRLQFDFSREAYDDLEQIRAELRAPSRAETVRYALRTLQWLIETVKGDHATFLVKRGNNPAREVVFPFIHSPTHEIVSTKSRRNGRKFEEVLEHSH